MLPLLPSWRLLAFLCLLAISPLTVARAEFVISELLAENSDTIVDEDGDSSDWVEIHNRDVVARGLGGYFLTDDAAALDKWRFPSLSVPAGGHVVVFCSGKGRAVAGRELHASFSLDKGGEYLALVAPDGRTVVHEYAPSFPRQTDDISYGLAFDGESTVILTGGSPLRWLVPTSSAQLGAGWGSPDFADGAWSTGQNGIGFDAADAGAGAGLPGVENLALGKPATQSSTLGGFAAGQSVDGDILTFSHTANGQNLPATWTVDLEDTAIIESIVIHNRRNCCPSRLRDITVSVLDDGGRSVFTSELLNPENVLGGGSVEDGPDRLTLDLVELTGGAVLGRRVRIVRTPDPDLSGSGGAGNGDEDDVLQMGEVEVLGYARPPSYDEIVETDVEAAMLGVNASAFVRVPFELTDGAAFDQLTLRVQYDDGFVAYLNGVEVARRNAPVGTTWNSAASEEHPDLEAFSFEGIDVSAGLAGLVDGRNILALHGLNRSATDDDFLLSIELVGRTVSAEVERFFATPTPGAVNSDDFFARVGDTRFSVDRGFFDAPFDVEITCETPDAEIRYTTDGSVPTASSGAIYTAPIRIADTTVLRAAAFRTGLVPSNVDSQTYVFPERVASSAVMNPAIAQDPIHGPRLIAGLQDIPSISFAVDFGRVNSSSEVPLSVEWLETDESRDDGVRDFQEDAGVKYFGGNVTNFAKKNFRLYFRGAYGAKKLRHPVFEGFDHGTRPVEEFDQLELRTGSHDMNQRGFYMSNRFTDDTMLDMGNLNPHGRFIHLYVNGTYWGQYHLRERWGADMHARYLGGRRGDYESIKGNRDVFSGPWPDPGIAYDGDGSTWEELVSRRGDFERARELLDVPHYIDFMLLYMFGNSESEFRCVGPKLSGSGFKFLLNDADGYLRDGGNRTGIGPAGANHADGPGDIFGALFAQRHPDYLALLGDRIHRHFFNDGAMTTAKNRERLEARCAEIERAFVAEAARWGYRTPESWEQAKTSFINGVLQTRTATVIGQFRTAGFYPSLEAPVFNQHGGEVPFDFPLTLSAPSGTIWFTDDGSDPRLPGGAVSPAARELSSGLSSTALVDGDSAVSALVPVDGALGLSWTQPGFDDSGWLRNVVGAGVGYDEAGSYDEHIDLSVEAQMNDVSSSVYVRYEFDVVDPAAFTGFRLAFRYDDGYVAYLNGEVVASRNAPTPLTWDAAATDSHVDSAAVVFEDAGIDLAAARALLRAGENVLAVHGLNRTASSSDMLIEAELSGQIAREEDRFAIERSSTLSARTRSGAEWSALTSAEFRVDSSTLRITELMYHPPSFSEEVAFDSEDFEFVELQNVGDRPLNLTGISFREGVDFTFPDGDGAPEDDLQPGEVVLIVKSLEAFSALYDTEGLYVAGEYGGRLANDGERIVLVDRGGRVLVDFSYSDSWSPSTDGDGASLEVVDPRADPASWGEATSWRASALLGTPGLVPEGGPQGLVRPGDVNGDGRLDLSDAVGTLQLLFAGPFSLPCGDGTIDDASNRALVDVGADGRVDLTDAVYTLNYLFQGGPPPALGDRCVALTGCVDSCLR